MRTNTLLTSLLMLQFFVSVLPASAQDVSSFAVEGHAFNAKTHEPLQNVMVELDIESLDASGGYGTSFPTDINGFYSFQLPVPLGQVSIVRFDATCKNRKGDVQLQGQLYNPPRAEIYRRDFHLTLPRGITRCVAQ